MPQPLECWDYSSTTLPGFQHYSMLHAVYGPIMLAI